ncbi:MAG: sulfatase [Planctomycetaceae bacterium]|nr:sulfatase [Planctomycetaceae bacterium]
MLTPYSRRDLLKLTSCGFGYAALAGMCTEASADYANPLSPKAPHFTPKAKRVIFLCMRGGPSHVDTFDYKPQLAKDDGKKSNSGSRTYLKSPWKFPKRGESGLPISDLFPNLSKHADDLCLLNGMYADIPNHPQSYIQMHTGDFRFVRPSVGAWTLYGLGTENQDLPGFVTITPEPRVGGAQNYGSAFLPAVYQGTRIGQLGRSLSNVEVKDIVNNRFSSDIQRDQVDLIQAMNRDLLKEQQVNTELEGVIESYELAFRMQSALPQLMDLSTETEATQKQYGIGQGNTDNFGRQCLLARKFAEAGVRYIELCHANWDQHGGLKARLTANCTAIDKPIAGLLADLKARDMLDDTLIVWGGEFGRTPHAKRADGRDHNATGFSMGMAGGGVKGGQRYGATDPHGVAAVENKTHFHDLHATMLYLLGLDHKKLTYRYAGRDFRLTDVYGRVLDDVIA